MQCCHVTQLHQRINGADLATDKVPTQDTATIPTLSLSDIVILDENFSSMSPLYCICTDVT